MAQVCVEARADGLVVAAPPRAAARHPSGQLVTGSLYGRAVHALVLPLLVEIASLVDAPLIGCGGIHSLEDARAFLDAGAVQLNRHSAVFVDPSIVSGLIDGLGQTNDKGQITNIK